MSRCAEAIAERLSPAFTVSVVIGGRRIALALATTRLTRASRVAGGLPDVAEDLTGQGHVTREVGPEPRVSIFVPLPG